MQSRKPFRLSSRHCSILECLLPWLIGGGVLACFFVLVLGNYSIKAYSDCHNWLVFARDFTHEITHSRWPWGFPLFLRGVLSLVGPYWVYLANLPVMLLLFVLASCAGLLFRNDGALRVPAVWAFLSVWSVVFATDANSFLHYLNPYRDPLSYVLLIASMVVFVRALASAVPRRRGWGVAGAGALLGLACSVREPSILMAAPMALYGFLAWRAGRRAVSNATSPESASPPFPFWATVFAFIAGMTVALIPLLVQTYLTTRQMILPPQASLESTVVPGADFTIGTFRFVMGKAWSYYTISQPWLLLLAAAGLVAAIVRRERFILALVAPAAAMYILFYGFYWSFVFRYFYVVLLFFALLGGYALTTLLGAIARIPRLGRALAWLVLAAAAWASGAIILDACPHGLKHQVPEARAMTKEWLAACPADTSVIYADRTLCEWLDWFTPWPSDALPVGPVPGQSPTAAIREALAPRLERGDTLLAACWGEPGGRGSLNATYLRRAYDRIPVTTLDLSPHHAHEYAQGPVTIYRIQPFSARRIALDWTIPAAGPRGPAYWYMLDTGEWLPEEETEPATATVTVDGTPLPHPIPHGGAWIGEAVSDVPSDSPRTVSAAVESSHPLPREMLLATGALDDPILLDFRCRAPFDHLWRWSGDVTLPTPEGAYGTIVFGTANVVIPVPHPALAGALLEWEMLVTDRIPGSPVVRVPVSVWEGDRLLASAELPANRTLVHFVSILPPDPDRDVRTLRLVVEPQPNCAYPGAPDVVAEIYHATLHRTPVDWPICLDGETPENDYRLLSGFHPAEGHGSSAYRWTSGPAEIAIALPDAPLPADAAPTLRIDWSAESVPEDIPDAGTLRVSWDGTPIDGQVVPDPDIPERLVWQAQLPPSFLSREVAHRLTLDAPAWRPANYGSRDRRTLGIRIFRVALTPERPSPPQVASEPFQD